ncbi:hypothetical protein [Polaromonas sp. YR568]|uniref:hypothetical protein n=1 Tax=Polaromonas sp. YR568 TaxID=1855301 RepID=UPI00398BBCE0
MKKYSMRSVPAAAAIAAAMLFGVQVHAQTNATTPSGSTPIAGSTSSKDAVTPAPTGGMAKDADARTAAKAEKRDKRAAKKASKQAARDMAATSSAGAPPITGGTK